MDDGIVRRHTREKSESIPEKIDIFFFSPIFTVAEKHRRGRGLELASPESRGAVSLDAIPTIVETHRAP